MKRSKIVALAILGASPIACKPGTPMADDRPFPICTAGERDVDCGPWTAHYATSGSASAFWAVYMFMLGSPRYGHFTTPNMAAAEANRLRAFTPQGTSVVAGAAAANAGAAAAGTAATAAAIAASRSSAPAVSGRGGFGGAAVGGAS